MTRDHRLQVPCDPPSPHTHVPVQIKCLDHGRSVSSSFSSNSQWTYYREGTTVSLSRLPLIVVLQQTLALGPWYDHHASVVVGFHTQFAISYGNILPCQILHFKTYVRNQIGHTSTTQAHPSVEERTQDPTAVRPHRWFLFSYFSMFPGFLWKNIWLFEPSTSRRAAVFLLSNLGVCTMATIMGVPTFSG
ncbi:hypothetical protein F5I97DRAFT_65474 [Phlebopus sp. FC_14]|nr:hypothetical protein F5I97DRAFT_65474 [Phlebopus sp. FC_14]